MCSIYIYSLRNANFEYFHQQRTPEMCQLKYYSFCVAPASHVAAGDVTGVCLSEI